MSNNIKEFPKGNYGVEFIGPFLPETKVVVDGCKVPYLSVIDHGDSVDLICDNRLGMQTVPKEEAQKWLSFIANCMAVAAGYSCHGLNSVRKPNPFKMQISEIEIE